MGRRQLYEGENVRGRGKRAAGPREEPAPLEEVARREGSRHGGRCWLGVGVLFQVHGEGKEWFWMSYISGLKHHTGFCVSKVAGKRRNGDQEGGFCRTPRETVAWTWVVAVERKERHSDMI